jgi:hypothetical protein
VDWIDEIASESVLPQAYDWLCERRRDHSPHDDVRDLRWRWDEIRPQLQAQLRAGTYRLGPVRRFHQGDETIEVWSALDALVLKATAIVLTAHWLPDFSPHCHRLPGRGGAKAAVRFVHEHLAANRFVFRTDVKSYYASMDHDLLLGLLEQAVPHRRVLQLLRQYVRRTIYDGGLYEDVERGISLGCPLSPLLGALYLRLLDERVEATGLTYARFRDDWVILAPTRWKLRVAIRLVNQTLAELRVEQHPDKTFIGRISRGFDFLGYAFKPAGLDAAPPTIERCAQRVSQLYEQGVDLFHIGSYLRRWLRWPRSGLRALGAAVSERALVLVVRSLGRMGVLGGCLPPMCLAFASQAVGDEGDGTEHRYDGG